MEADMTQPLRLEGLNEDLSKLKSRMADLEAERAALVKAVPGAG
jgi:hypothetical protein